MDWEASFRFTILFGIILSWIETSALRDGQLPGSGCHCREPGRPGQARTRRHLFSVFRAIQCDCKCILALR